MNLRPSPAQIEAGNYSKDHVSVHGLRVSIENPAGSTRRGKGADGKPWASKMHNDYGYIRGTTGRDKDHVDVFLSDSHRDSSLPVHVVDQVDPDTGEFDEHKVMLGWPDEDSAMEAYLKHYPAGWDGAKAVTAMSLPDFKKWAFQSGRRVKPVSELGVAKFCGGGAVKKYADGGAAFGVFPQLGRRAEANNDRAGSADMPFQAARGWAAGTAGLPGDVEGVMRQLIKAGAAPDSWVDRNMSADPALPTSEFYKEWLPGAPKGAGSRAAMELGSLTGGAGSTTGARVLKKGADAAGLGLARAIDAGMQPGGLLTKLAPGAQPLYAVKPKGGNWDPSEPWDMMDEMVFGAGLGRAPRPNEPEYALAGWRAKQLQKYVRNLMGTADDPLLKLEKEGRLHLSPEDVIDRASQEGHFAQRGADNTSFDGDPTHLRLTGRPHRTPWEAYSDSLLQPRTPEDVTQNLINSMEAPYDGDMSIASFARENPDLADELKSMEWVDKIDPATTPIWAPVTDAHGGFAGLEHVNDYLRQALQAGEHADALREGPGGMHPFRAEEAQQLKALVDRGLHLTPEQLARTSVPDAVAKTAEWNKLLAEGKRLEDMNKGVKAVHRQYDTGHQWVELSPEGLAGEGKAMRHCVGGYCSSVESGDTRILSLRGKDGQPKVTVEVAKGKGLDHWVDNMPEGIYQDLVAQFGELHPDIVARGRPNSPEWAEFLRNQKGAPKQDSWDIRQIKGPANRAPSAEVQAHVQDLVRNGLGDGLSNWGKVGDLRNAGMHELSGALPWNTSLADNSQLRAVQKRFHPEATDEYSMRINPEVVMKAYRDEALGGRQYGTQADWDNWVKGLSGPPAGLKAGGKVVNGIRYLMEGGGGDVGGGFDGGGYEGGYDGGDYGGNNWGGDVSGPAPGTPGGGVPGNVNPAEAPGAFGSGNPGYTGGAGAGTPGGMNAAGYEGNGFNSNYGNIAGPAAPSQSAGSKIADFMLGLAVPGYGLMNGLSKATTDKSLSQQLSEAFSNFGVGSGTQSTDQGEPDHYEGAGIGALGSVLGAADMNALAPEVVNGTVGAGTPWADPMALGNHALRVYDPVFAPGTAAPRGY